ncbi:MAG: hypothetical protein IT433_10210 [Phycisphaerales bacterium]|nr:hypothetical protein [Phycisphaerales bacterium]
MAEPGAHLESPVLPDVTPNTTLLVEYSVWYVSNLGDTNDVEGVVEFLRGTVVVPATPPAELRPADSAHRWQRKRAVFNTGETPGAECKLRFRMIDPPPDSTVEIGIDDVRVSLITFCEECCDADMDADGNIDQDDIAYLIGVVGGDPNPSGVDPDFNHDGNVEQDDVADLVSYVGGAGCP